MDKRDNRCGINNRHTVRWNGIKQTTSRINGTACENKTVSWKSFEFTRAAADPTGKSIPFENGQIDDLTSTVSREKLGKE